MNIFTEHEPSWKDQGYFLQPIVWIRLVFCGFGLPQPLLCYECKKVMGLKAGNYQPL